MTTPKIRTLLIEDSALMQIILSDSYTESVIFLSWPFQQPALRSKIEINCADLIFSGGDSGLKSFPEVTCDILGTGVGAEGLHETSEVVINSPKQVHKKYSNNDCMRKLYTFQNFRIT